MSPGNFNGSTSGLIKQPAAIDRWPRGIAYRNGFCILGTPICFRDAKHTGLRFIATLGDRAPTVNERVLASRVLAEAMGWSKRGIDVLALDYRQKIKLGRMEITLYPAGLHPGSAELEISYRERRILYCGGVCLHQPLSSPPCEIPPCDLLLVDAAPADPKPPAPRQAAKRLLDWLRETLQRGMLPVVLTGTPAAALETAWVIGETDWTVHAQRPLFEMFRRADTLGARLPELRRLRDRLPVEGVVLHGADAWPRSRFAGLSGARVAFVGPGRATPPYADTGFRLAEGADRPALVSYVQRSGARQVALGTECDESLAKLLEKTGVQTFRISPPKQIPLPF
jgi:hypothetical protein